MRLHYNTELKKKQDLFRAKDEYSQKLKNIENKGGKKEKIANKIVVLKVHKKKTLEGEH